MNARWVLPMIGALVGWALWGLFAALASEHGSTRGVFAGVILVEAVMVLPLIRSVPASFSGWMIATGIAGAAAYGLMFLAFQQGGPTSTVVAVTAAYPALTAILAMLFMGEHFDFRKAVGIAMVVGGIVLLSVESGGNDDQDGDVARGASEAAQVAR